MEPTSARALLAKYGLAPSRERGQSFLSDPNVARKVVDAVDPRGDEIVVEIGPGLGAITFGLAERAAHVVAVEYDAGLVRAFREEYGSADGITLVHGDALDLDLRGIAESHGVGEVVLAGNLPYSITSPAIGLAIEARERVGRAVFMVQKEVADRLLSEPGARDYSALTAIVRFHASVRAHFPVRGTCFHPRPAVDSMVVEIEPRTPDEGDVDPGLYSKVVHAAFGTRRKMLRRALARLAREAGTSVGALEVESGIDLTRRGETLSVEEFGSLARALGSERARRDPKATNARSD
ncbi:MAG: ribosomal RNA small subunit methyltransferase A [Candidatus Eisenbacteria bacterium]|nr:ribosomal RNA small subunit methyltransferase A [Candidatus Eisenbacteria bacterium]